MSLPGRPSVPKRQQNDIDIQLWVKPAATPARDTTDWILLRDAHEIALSYTDGSDHNGLSFTIYKDSKGVRELGEDREVVARWWDPRRRKWMEPPGSRFVVLRTDEDAMDQTNSIDYGCIAISWLLEKVKVRTTGYVNHASRLNRDYDRAKERYEEAERDYDSLLREFERVGRQIQNSIWPNISKGPLFAVRGRAWLIRDRKARFRSLVSNVAFNGQVSWYSRDRGRFVAMNMSSGNATLVDRKRRFRELGPQVYNARQKMNQRRASYSAAERAARETSRSGTRFFYNRTPGRVITTLWREGWERDTGFVGHNDGEGTWDSPYTNGSLTLKGLWRHFNERTDSKGKNWTSSTPRTNWEISLGQSLWEVIQDFRERGLIDVRVGGTADGGGGRSLQLVPKGGFEVDQTSRVALRLGNDALEAPESIDRSGHQSITFVLDSTGLNRYTHWNRGSSSTQTPWGMWEGSISEPAADSLATSMSMTADRRREASRRFQVDASRKSYVSPGGPIPMLDYEPHHLITVHDHEGATSERRVTQVIVEKSGQDSVVTATVRLGTRFTNKRVSYAKTLNKALGGSEHMQGHVPLSPAAGSTEPVQDALFAPALTDLSTRVVFNEAGRAQVALSGRIPAHDIPEPEDAGSFDDSTEGSGLIDDEEYEGE